MDTAEELKDVVLEMDEEEEGFYFASSISEAMVQSQQELAELNENIDSIQHLKSDADQIDYMLAASAGALSGLIDIFVVGKPGESPLGQLSDIWFENRTRDFAKLTGWSGGMDNSLASAVRHLENKFKIPYDQTGTGDAGAKVFGLTPRNHHFKSLAHNPNLLGLFYSILNQFQNSSTFVTEGELITLHQADAHFELRGRNVPSKLFAAFSNWIGHLISDVSGSSSSKGRGMGIPSPLWTWINSTTAIKRKLRLPVSKFDQNVYKLALEIFNEGYDLRFQTAQTIPVFINELLVRFLYSLRRMTYYFSTHEPGNDSFKEIWKVAEPFTHPTVKRMLTVAHATFCLIDVTDASIRSFQFGVFQSAEFFLRFNLIGVGRLTISLYGEGKRAIVYRKVERESSFAMREKVIIQHYLEGLKTLAERYDDKEKIKFITDFKSSDLYIQVFEESVTLAQQRQVADEKILKNKSEIDSYFMGE